MIPLKDNPPILWPDVVLSRDAEVEWTAVYTKPRQEKALAWDLLQKKIPYFLPMVQRETSSGGRRRRNLYPLFPSYLFIAGGEAEQISVLKTDRAVRLVRTEPGGQSTLRGELTALEMALRNFPDSLELHANLLPGVPVRIKAGPMAGIEGIVLQVGSKHRLWLGVSCLGVGATVEIHPDLVEAI
jgi:transcription antitermination factor NusG